MNRMVAGVALGALLTVGLSVPALATNSPPPSIAVGAGTSALAIDEDRGTMYVENRNDYTVSIVDLGSAQVKATVPVGSGPFGVAVNPATNTAYSANFGGLSMTVIDGATNTVKSTVPLGFFPGGIAVNPITNRIYVMAAYEGNVRVFDGATNALIATIPLDGYPALNSRDIAVNTVTNTVYIGGGEKLNIIDGNTDSVTTLELGTNIATIAVDEKSNKVYTSGYTPNAGVTVVSGDTNTLSGTIPTSIVGAELAVDSTRHLIYVMSQGRQVEVLDGGSNLSIGTTLANSPSAGISVNENTGVVYVSHSDRTVEPLTTPRFTASPPPPGTVGEYYAYDFSTIGSGDVVYSLVSGVLPPGLEFDSTMGIVDGDPTVPGDYTFAVAATNGMRPEVPHEITITVAPLPEAPAITSGPPAEAVQGKPYEFNVTATGTGPIKFSIVDGALPAGLELDPASGRISGTPTSVEIAAFTIQVENLAGVDTASHALSVVADTVVPPTPDPDPEPNPGVKPTPVAPQPPTGQGETPSTPTEKLANTGAPSPVEGALFGALILAAGLTVLRLARARQRPAM